jgi:hypothetical protein
MRPSVAGTIPRRRFACAVMSALTGGLAIALPWPHAETRAGLGALLRHRASAERIGRRYLATLPAGTDESRLRAMSPVLGQVLRAVQHRPEVAADLLRRSIDEDFRRGDTVIVNGWVLAATEARFCAVVALA